MNAPTKAERTKAWWAEWDALTEKQRSERDALWAKLRVIETEP